MKKNVTLAVLMIVSTVIFAQKRDHDHKGHDPKDRAAKSAEQMKKELLLNDDQYAKVKSLNEKYYQKYSALRKDTSLTGGRTMNRMKTIRGQQETELQTILTSEQLAKWNALKSKQQEERKNQSKDRRPKPDHDNG